MRHPIRVLLYVHRGHAWHRGRTSHHADAPTPEMMSAKLVKASQSGFPVVAIPQYRMPGEDWENADSFAYCLPKQTPRSTSMAEDGWAAVMQKKFDLRGLMET